jgi:2-C-methyl-D-erythritol 4-phosphate cytidylyltransferase
MKAYGILVAGGHGKRMGAMVPKQLLKLGGVTILKRTLAPFLKCPDIAGIVIVAEESIVAQISDITHNIYENSKGIAVVKGGTERQDSVMNGLETIPDDTDIIVIHDAVRPFVTSGLISQCVQSAIQHGAVTVARSITETVKVIDNGMVVKTLDRSQLYSAQTPQAFRAELIRNAHRKARKENFTGTDDCMLVERLGYPVYIIEGNDMNIKITTPTDLMIAGAMLPLFEKAEV